MGLRNCPVGHQYPDHLPQCPYCGWSPGRSASTLTVGAAVAAPQPSRTTVTVPPVLTPSTAGQSPRTHKRWIWLIASVVVAAIAVAAVWWSLGQKTTTSSPTLSENQYIQAPSGANLLSSDIPGLAIATGTTCSSQYECQDATITGISLPSGQSLWVFHASGIIPSGYSVNGAPLQIPSSTPNQIAFYLQLFDPSTAGHSIGLVLNETTGDLVAHWELSDNKQFWLAPYVYSDGLIAISGTKAGWGDQIHVYDVTSALTLVQSLPAPTDVPLTQALETMPSAAVVDGKWLLTGQGYVDIRTGSPAPFGADAGNGIAYTSTPAGLLRVDCAESDGVCTVEARSEADNSSMWAEPIRIAPFHHQASSDQWDDVSLSATSNTVIVNGGDGTKLAAYQASTGSPLWQATIPCPADSYYDTNDTKCGTILGSDEGAGLVYLWDANTTWFASLDTGNIGLTLSDGHAPDNIAPTFVIANATVYVASGCQLTGYSTTKGSKQWTVDLSQGQCTGSWKAVLNKQYVALFNPSEPSLRTIAIG